MKTKSTLINLSLLLILVGVSFTANAQGSGRATGHNWDTFVINQDRNDVRGEFRMQTGQKSFTFSHMNQGLGLFYQSTYTGWQNRGSEIFTIGRTGNTRMNNSFIGDVGHGSDWASFAHNNRRYRNEYSLLAHKDGKYTLINKKNTGNGYIGFRIGNSDKMVLTNSGNIGIGTTSPGEKLQVVGYGRFQHSSSTSNYLEMGHGGSNSFINNNGVGNIDFRYQGKDLMSLSKDGFLGIGTDNPAEKLDVVGNIRVTTGDITINDGQITLDTGNVTIGQSQLSSSTDTSNTMLTITGGVKTDKVILNIGSFPDYVFADEYPLMPIEDVAAYITENKHLPNIPSEKEIVETGLDVRMISTKLVEKVEELTLYTIQQDKKLKEQDELISALIQRLERLENKQTK